MDMSRGYEIKPASEGGFVVHGKPVGSSPFAPPGVTETPATVAFSNASDLIVWLANSHEVSIAVNEGLCKDEGCPQYGTDHVCTNWIEWSGYSMLENDQDKPCVARLRDGREVSVKTFDLERHWNWANRTTAENDIVAYRLV